MGLTGSIYESLRKIENAEYWKEQYCELLAIARKVANREAGLSELKAFRPHFDALYEVFRRGWDYTCIQRGGFVESWVETPLGLLKLVEEIGTEEIQCIQIVGERHIYYPD